MKYAMVSEQWMLGTYVLAMATEDLCAKIAHVQSAVVQTGLGVRNRRARLAYLAFFHVAIAACL